MVAILGPTAAGKSDAALEVAAALDGEIVSVDSMQVYRGMDIGTAKPGPADRARIPHHLIDLVDPEESFTVAEFQAAGRAVLAAIGAAGRTAVIVGGSGLHFRSLVDPLRFPPTDPDVRQAVAALEPGEALAVLLGADPQAGRWVDTANPRRVARALEILQITGLTPSGRAATDEARAFRAYRPEIPFTAVGLDPGESLAARVEARFDRMLEAGLLEEVRALAGRLGPTASQAVGYKELIPVTTGRASVAEGRAAAVKATLETARRQRTYFRRDPRIRWSAWQDDAGERARAVLDHVQEAACIS